MILVVLGTIVVIYSLATDHKLGAIRFLRIRLHRLLDAVFLRWRNGAQEGPALYETFTDKRDNCIKAVMAA
ncbi:hypothetical protein [Pararhizobium gei]|uniref:hypothetical protein n=1 Tax=Pararhizobium gei TaxID=1395951 RepID=UPI0023DB29E0|nr:hypothetical protein [Rhizobium gei]